MNDPQPSGIILKSLGFDTPLPQGRQGGAITALPGSFLFLGGGGMGPSLGPGNEQCWSLQVDGSGNFNVNPWVALAPIPTPVTLTTASVVNGKIYLVGGFGRTRWEQDYANQVQCYDPAANSWTAPTTAPGWPLTPIASAAIGTKIYVVAATTLAGGADPPAIVQIYDTVANSWTNGPPLPQSTYVSQCAVIGTILYVSGDFAPTFAFDTVANSWATLPVIPGWAPDQSGGAVVSYGPYLLVLGGAGMMGSALDSAWAFDTRSQAWAQIGTLAMARGVAAAAVMGQGDPQGLIYLAGGVPSRVNNPPFANVEAIGVALTYPE